MKGSKKKKMMKTSYQHSHTYINAHLLIKHHRQNSKVPYNLKSNPVSIPVLFPLQSQLKSRIFVRSPDLLVWRSTRRRWKPDWLCWRWAWSVTYSVLLSTGTSPRHWSLPPLLALLASATALPCLSSPSPKVKLVALVWIFARSALKFTHLRWDKVYI